MKGKTKNVQKKGKKTYNRKKRMYKAKLNRAYVPRDYEILNRQNQMKIYTFKENQATNDIVGTGTSISGGTSFNPEGAFTFFAQLKNNFKQYKLHYVRLRFRLNNIELTDNAVIPTLYVRYMYDPNANSANVTEAGMLRLNNCVRKQLQNNNGSNSDTLVYTIKPAILQANNVYGSSTGINFSPKFNQWCDIGTLLSHWGYLYFIDNLPTGMSISLDTEICYSFRDPSQQTF